MGVTAQEFYDEGFSPSDLTGAGFTRAEVRDAGFKAKQLLKKCGWTKEDIKEAGFTAKELARDPELQRPSALAAHPDFEGFIAWIRKQPPEFNARMRKTRRLRK